MRHDRLEKGNINLEGDNTIEIYTKRNKYGKRIHTHDMSDGDSAFGVGPDGQKFVIGSDGLKYVIGPDGKLYYIGPDG